MTIALDTTPGNAYAIHDTLPSGFSFADRLQVEEFEDTGGSVHGASKVCLVRGAGGEIDLAVRLRPPRKVDDIEGELGRRAAQTHGIRWYIDQYNLGWQASLRVDRTGQTSEAWDSGETSHAWDDGYLDHAAGRPKWHLTYCLAHDECGEG